MGTISYWMSEASRLPPGSVADAIRPSELEIKHEDGEWVVVVRGFPQEWHQTQEAAERSASKWAAGHLCQGDAYVEHVPGGTWLVLTGDQYVFSSSMRAEVEGFVFGVLVGNDMAHNGAPRWLAGGSV